MKKFKVTKITPSGDDRVEEMNESEVSKFMLTSAFMTMLKRVSIGEKLFYNEKNIWFERIE